METKSLLQELCLNLERDLTKESPHKRTVTLFSGIKPSNYFLPQMHLGTSKTIPTEEKNAWFVELSVDSKVIFRESYIPKESEDLKIVEGMLLNRVLREVFKFGVMSSKSFLEATELP